MTDELRALLRADLEAEQPPPLGDIVGAAIRDGRRRRRNRRLGAFGASAALAGIVAFVIALMSDFGASVGPSSPIPAAAGPSAEPAEALSPGSVPIEQTAPTALAPARTLTIHSGTQRAEGMQKKATSAAMLHLLTQLLPPGRTSHYGVAPDNDLHVQLYFDEGDGPGMVRVTLDRAAPLGDQPPRDGAAIVTVRHFPDNCLQSTVVAAEWADGTVVQMDVATCLAWDGIRNTPARPALTDDEAVKVVADPRWGPMMDAALVDTGGRRFPELPVFG